MTAPYPLPAILDTAAATPLRAALLARVERREPLLIDGAAVTRAGMACLQVLASARATVAADGLGYRVVEPSAALREMAALAGLDAALHSGA